VAPARASILLGGQTIAGGAPATSSDVNGDATRVNDGRLANGTANEWTNVADGAYFTIDLGRQVRVSDLNLLNGLNFNDRQTKDFTVHMSTTGAFAGEQQLMVSSTAQPKASGFQDVTLPAFSNPSNTQLVGRYLRFTAVNHVTGAGQYGPGVAELTVRGVSDRGTGALAPMAVDQSHLNVKAYTRTVDLTDTAPASYALRLLTPTSSSIVQSNGSSYIVTGSTFFGDGNVTNNANDGGGSEVVWNGGTIMNDLSQGYVTLDLGQEMIIDGFNLRNSTSTSNDRGTKNYLIRISNDPSFAEQNNTEILTGIFSGLGATDSKTLSNPMLGRYVRFIASDFYGFSAGLDDLTVLGRTFTSQLVSSGSGQLGDSSNFGLLTLGQDLPLGPQLLALGVTGTGGGWSSSTLQLVVIPEPTGMLAMAGILMMMVRRRRH
jgi:hypothetical protein